jgi:asparagine synthase (glutamine-hydrolysing)
LFTNYWGRYSGVLYDPNKQSLTLIRDALGLSTIFYFANNHGIVFSTELSLLYDILKSKPALDWNYFAEYIINENHSLPTTPFAEIKELLPAMGFTINYAGNVSHELLWDINHLRGTFIQDKQAFEEELLFNLKACTKAWFEKSTGICVELSGGVDSSALVILLKDVLPNAKLIAVNYIDSKTQSSNEIAYAQEIADACNMELFFIDWQNTSLLDPLPNLWRPNRPSSFLLNYTKAQQLMQIASSNGCNEIANGQGGDHLFLATPPESSLADVWLSQGLRNSFGIMRDLCEMQRMPWWQLINKNIISLANHCFKINSKTNSMCPYLDSAFLEQLITHNYYLKNRLHSFYPGKSYQFVRLSHAVSYAERNQGHQFQTYCHPLLSQPVVETAFRIPTYQSFEKGYDRIFLRRTISRIKHTKALWRTMKGHTAGTSTKMFAHNAHTIRDIILQGSLIKSGIINKHWLNDEIIRIKHGQSNNLWPLLHITVSQLWLNQWNL